MKKMCISIFIALLLLIVLAGKAFAADPQILANGTLATTSANDFRSKHKVTLTDLLIEGEYQNDHYSKPNPLERDCMVAFSFDGHHLNSTYTKRLCRQRYAQQPVGANSYGTHCLLYVCSLCSA
jgi:hypothetical protein